MTPGAPEWLPAEGRLRQLFGRTALYPYYEVALARVLAGELPATGPCSVLDVGTGDGLLADVLRLRPETTVLGVETYIRSAGRPAVATARFDGHGAGWVVYGPGSAHSPTVTGGRALVLYLLPQGAIEFTPPA